MAQRRVARRSWAVGVVVAAGLLATACTTGTAVSIPHLLPSKVAHTASDAAACQALDAVYATTAAHQPNTPQQGQTLITDALAAHNLDIVNEAVAMHTDSVNGDDNGVRTQIEAMSATCNSMGIGPS